jgi:hypothetical protein
MSGVHRDSRENARQAVSDFHVAVARTQEPTRSVLLTTFALVPLSSSGSTPGRVLQTLPELGQLLKNLLLVLDAPSKALPEWPELLEFGSEQGRLHAGIAPVQEEDVRHIVVLNLQRGV